MKANPLDQLKRICGQLLSRVANLNKSFKSFFTETMICYLSITGRVNFSQMARFGSSCESRFRQNFKKRFDWVAFNTGLASVTDGHLRAIALDPCYIPKSGKRTPGLGYFWSGTANAAKRGLEILDMALVDATDRLAVFLTAAQTFVEKRKGRIPDYLAHMDDPNSLLGLYLRAFAGVADRLRGLTSLVVADAYFAKRTFVTGLADCQARNKNSLDFAFNASLTAVNLAKAVAKGSGLDLSVEDVKLLIHNAVMVQRIFSMFGKTPNMNLNHPIFKELLFYGVKSAA